MAIAIPVFWLLSASMRMGFLAFVSFVYLMTLEPVGILVLLGWSLCFYFFSPSAKESPKSSWVLPLLIAASFGYLAYFKYVPRIIVAFSDEPLLQKIVIPLGISYFTFKLIHYALEVSRGNINPHPIQDFLCYIFLLPIFTAGPIERFDHFQSNRSSVWKTKFAVEGLTRIIHGLIKKLVLGNLILLPLFDKILDGATLFTQLHTLPSYKVWFFCFLSFLNMYLDFSAYSDIAIGSSRLFGLRIMENFNWPILSENISVFWKRWHMSLAGWCLSYIYMPVIGLTRNPYVATYLTFCSIGLWHSGSLAWLAWGLYHATGISVFGYWSRYRRRRNWKGLDRPYGKFLGIPLTLAFVSGGSVLTAVDGASNNYHIIRVLAKLVFIDLPT
ncbi:MAG: MBOAT family O-acyltransferase [Pirellulales bacterium]